MGTILNIMKTLKFAPELCEQIITGTKTSTWRLFDDKDLTVGDELQFINKESGICFGGGYDYGFIHKDIWNAW